MVPVNVLVSPSLFLYHVQVLFPTVAHATYFLKNQTDLYLFCKCQPYFSKNHEIKLVGNDNNTSKIIEELEFLKTN